MWSTCIFKSNESFQVGDKNRKVSFSTVEYYESCSSLAVWHWGLIPRHCFGAMEMYCTTTQQINGGARLMVGLHKAAPCRTCYLFPWPWSCCFGYILPGRVVLNFKGLWRNDVNVLLKWVPARTMRVILTGWQGHGIIIAIFSCFGWKTRSPVRSAADALLPS